VPKRLPYVPREEEIRRYTRRFGKHASSDLCPSDLAIHGVPWRAVAIRLDMSIRPLPDPRQRGNVARIACAVPAAVQGDLRAADSLRHKATTCSSYLKNRIATGSAILDRYAKAAGLPPSRRIAFGVIFLLTWLKQVSMTP